MNIEKLRQLVEIGESESLEFKKTTSQLKPALETLCAFLNNKGGTVLLGVSDKGKIVGQDVTDSTRQEIAKEINRLEPPYEVTVEYIPILEGKEVIALHVEKGLYPPYCYDGRAFMRTQSTTSRMPQHYYEQLLVRRGQLNYAWDEASAAGYSLDDLDYEEIRRTIRLGIEENRLPEAALTDTIPDVLKRLKLISDDHLTNACVLLYAKDVLPNYPQFHIQMARFKGLDRLGEFLDNQSFYGNAFNILAEANNFIRRHLPIASHYQENSFERVDVPALPPLAIREAIINALCHTDYSNRNSSIYLALYDDRLELWNYGGLPKGITIESLKTIHESQPRNRLVATQFYNRGLIEKWGTGTLKMYNLCNTQGLPLPEFKEYSGGLSVTLRFAENATIRAEKIPDTQQLTDRQHSIVNILRSEGNLNIRELMEKLPFDTSERTMRRELSYLEKVGVLGAKGRTSSKAWFFKKS